MGILGPTNMTGLQAGGMGIEIDMEPSPVLLVAQFNKLGLDIRSFREPLKRAIQKVVSPSIGMNFEKQGRPKWTVLAQRTIARKSAEGFKSNASTILRKTGALTRAAKALNSWDIDGREGLAVMQVPDKVWYGKVHQQGSGEIVGYAAASGSTQAGEQAWGSVGYVPQRVWAVIQPEDVDDIERVFEEWLDERVRAVALGRSVI